MKNDVKNTVKNVLRAIINEAVDTNKAGIADEISLFILEFINDEAKVNTTQEKAISSMFLFHYDALHLSHDRLAIITMLNTMR